MLSQETPEFQRPWRAGDGSGHGPSRYVGPRASCETHNPSAERVRGAKPEACSPKPAVHVYDHVHDGQGEV